MYETGYTGVGMITGGDARFSGDACTPCPGKSIALSDEILSDTVAGLVATYE